MVFIEDKWFVYIKNEIMLNAVRKEVDQDFEITQILTHEQFEANAYKVKGEW